jgi:hypothetical protein
MIEPGGLVIRKQMATIQFRVNDLAEGRQSAAGIRLNEDQRRKLLDGLANARGSRNSLEKTPVQTKFPTQPGETGQMTVVG